MTIRSESSPVALVHWNSGGKKIRKDTLGPEWDSIFVKEAVKFQVLNSMKFVFVKKQMSIVKVY